MLYFYEQTIYVQPKFGSYSANWQKVFLKQIEKERDEAVFFASLRLLLPTKCDKMRDIFFKKLCVGDSTNETIGRRGIPCLYILGKLYNLGARPSKIFSVNSSFVKIFLFCFNQMPTSNMFTTNMFDFELIL